MSCGTVSLDRPTVSPDSIAEDVPWLLSSLGSAAKEERRYFSQAIMWPTQNRTHGLLSRQRAEGNEGD